MSKKSFNEFKQISTMRRGKIFIGIAFLVLIVVAFKKKPQGQIVCFGDSITYGGMAKGHSWVWYLQQANYLEVNFVNEGRSGRKTSDRSEILPVLEKYPQADYYLIFLGVNDLKNGTETMVDSCVANIRWIINKIKVRNSHTKIVLLAPTSINTQTMSQINVDKKYNGNTQIALNILEKKYQDLAKREHIGFISLLHTVSEANYADGLHPNEEGQKQIGEAVWKGLNHL